MSTQSMQPSNSQVIFRTVMVPKAFVDRIASELRKKALQQPARHFQNDRASVSRAHAYRFRCCTGSCGCPHVMEKCHGEMTCNQLKIPTGHVYKQHVPIPSTLRFLVHVQELPSTLVHACVLLGFLEQLASLPPPTNQARPAVVLTLHADDIDSLLHTAFHKPQGGGRCRLYLAQFQHRSDDDLKQVTKEPKDSES
eukprot:1729255-Amphidinium_carterae.1